MKTFYQIVIGLLAAACAFLYFDRGCAQRQLRLCQADYSDLRDSITTAPVQSDTILQTVTATDTVYISIPKPVISVVNNDTLRTYTGKYNTDLLQVRWRAEVFGELKSLMILPGSGYKFREITIEKTVTLAETRHTASAKAGRDKSHLFLTGGFAYRDRVHGGELGLMYIRRGKWGVQAGVFGVDGEWYYRAGLIMKLK